MRFPFRPHRPGVFEVSIWAFAALLVAPFAAHGATPPPAPGHAMGSAPCVWAAPIEGPGRQLDVSATVQALRVNRFDCYVLVIGSAAPNSFSDLKRLLPAAQSAGISVWAVLIPPTEGGKSLPYRTDFVAWMRALARLSQKYPSLRGANIDDLFIDDNAKLFTHAYLHSIYLAKQQINPKFLFVPTVYDLGPAEANLLSGCVDGVWFWWVNLEKNDGWRSLLEDSRAVVHGRFPVYGGVYAHSTSWHRQDGPSPVIVKGSLEIACRYSNGAVVWNLPLAPAQNPLLHVVRSFAPGGSAPLAGRCGIASP